jgi:hypothetical protein
MAQPTLEPISEPMKEGQGKTAMWLRLLWQMRELLPLLGKMLPLLEGWVAGNSGASVANSRALQQLEARLGNTQEGLGGLEGQLRDHGAALLHLGNEMKQLRAQVEAEASRRKASEEQLAADIASLRSAVVYGFAICGVLLMLVAAVTITILQSRH